jgi:hypothetical protein
MKHTHTVLSEDGKRVVYIMQCEHCGAGSQAMNPPKLELLDLANCGGCKMNSRGERDDFDFKNLECIQ